ncbi:hypothetical protein MMC26_001752 [Xylographa opegraphella]|nr:hypothetical protein [Xylographa opegraphella]
MFSREQRPETSGEKTSLENINSSGKSESQKDSDIPENGSKDASGVSDKSSDSSNFGTLVDLRNTKKDLEDEDWEIIKPALRPTSAFLDSEASFVFFYSLINSDREFTIDKYWEKFYPKILKTNPYQVPDQSIKDVRTEYATALDIMAKQLELRFSDNRSAEGYTIYQKHRRLQFTTKNSRVVVGHGCDVVMHETIFWKPLRRLRQLPQTPSVISATLRIEFKMANVLGHEMAHVVERATRDQPPWNAFWCGQRVAELGRAWETEVYGATLLWGKDLSAMAPLLSVKWPHWDAGTEFSWGAKRLPKGSRTLYVVAMRQIGLLSSQRFWDFYRGSRRRKLLWCPRIIGIRQTYHRKIDQSWDRKRSSEVFEPDERGVLLTVSVLTLASFIVTSIFYHQRTLKPRTNAYVNGSLSVLWMLGFALLAWNLSGLLSHRCTIENWSSELGVMICRIYKALMSFTVIGMLATLCALILDIHTHRATSHLGAYGSMRDPPHDSKNLLHPASEFSDNPNIPSYRQPDLEFPEFSHETKQPYRVQKPIEAGQFGYAAPTEQTSYAGASDMGDLGLMQGPGYASGGVV